MYVYICIFLYFILLIITFLIIIFSSYIILLCSYKISTSYMPTIFLNEFIVFNVRDDNLI